MNIVNINTTLSWITSVQSIIPVLQEYYWAVVAFALIVFIVALILSLLFLLRENKVTVSSKQDTAPVREAIAPKKATKATRQRLGVAFSLKEKAELLFLILISLPYPKLSITRKRFSNCFITAGHSLDIRHT